MNNENYNGVLRPADLELIERVIYKNGDDVAVSIARSFERLEERMESVQSSLLSRLTEIEKQLGMELLEVRSLIEDKGEALIIEA